MTASEVQHTVKAITIADVSPFDDSSPLLGNPEALRERAARDGYLFFRGLVDPEPVMEVRRAVLGVLRRHDLLSDDAAEADHPASGHLDLDRLRSIPADQLRPDIGVTQQQYFEIQQLPQLHVLPHHPSLRAFYEDFFGEEIFIHPRHILRAITPHPAMDPTPPHQDFQLVQGTTDTWTGWLPLGACDVARGPLVVLRGSHRAGPLPISSAPGAGGIAAQLCEGEDDWVGGDFEAGDLLTFSSLTVHRGLRATVTDQIRLSMDIRYQRKSDGIEVRSLGNHCHRLWPDIYEGWPERYRHVMNYWETEDLDLIPWDDSLMQPGATRPC